MTPFDFTNELLLTNFRLGERAGKLGENTALVRDLPEFDSMAVVNLVGAIREELACEIDADDVTIEVFEAIGSPVDFFSERI